MMLPLDSQRVLLGRETSRANKLALVAEYRRVGYRIQWKWCGEPRRSRLSFCFLVFWTESKSYEDDVAPLLQLHGVVR